VHRRTRSLCLEVIRVLNVVTPVPTCTPLHPNFRQKVQQKSVSVLGALPKVSNCSFASSQYQHKADLTPENTLSLPGRPQVSQHDDTTASLYPPTNVTSRGTEESFLSPRWTDDAPCQARTTAGTSEPFQFGSGLGGHRSLMEELYGDTGEYPAGALFSC
jgi:hypothetical protein